MPKPEPLETHETLEKLHELTGQLPSVPNGHPVSEQVRWRTPCGSAIGYELLYLQAISCCRVEFEVGTKFPRHVHQGTEYLIVYMGGGIIRLEEEEQAFAAPGLLIVPPNKRHEISFTAASSLVAVTMPADPGFPGGLRHAVSV